MPAVLRTPSGDALIPISAKSGGTHYLRVVEFVPGKVSNFNCVKIKPQKVLTVL